MIVYGYAMNYQYTNEGTMLIQVRIPAIHGPMNKKEYKGANIRNYVNEENLPWYQSLLLSNNPLRGQVVALSSLNDTPNDFLVLGLTGGQYSPAGLNTID